MKRPYTLLYCLFLICCTTALATQPRQQLIDSLNRKLARTRNDTTRIKLQYLAGETMNIQRPGYWDTIVTEACRLHVMHLAYKSLYRLNAIYKLTDRKKSVESIRKIVELATAEKNKPEMMRAMLDLTQKYFYYHELKQGTDLCYQGLKIAEELRDTLYIASFNSKLANFYRVSGELGKSLAMNLACLQLFKKLNNPYEIVSTLLDIGTLYKELGNTKKSVAYYLSTKKYVADLGQSLAAAETYVSIGAAYRQNNEPRKAEPYFRTSYEMSKALGCISCEAGALAGWAENNYSLGNLKIAEKQALASLNLAREESFKAQIPFLAELLTKIYEAQHKYEQALVFHKLFLTTRDSVSNEQNRKTMLEKQFAYNFEKKENENKLLAQQNQIQLMRLKQNSFLIIALCSTMLLILIIAWLLARQNKWKQEQQSMHMEHRLLRSQMNPHFIFNSLQAIQNFMLKQDIKEAVTYLSSFSFITRTVLESSATDQISLKQEIVLLENYLQLQKLRFGNRFDYFIHVDERVDAEHVNIPSMLAQPFIENAVEHGMDEIETGGTIVVSYTRKDDFLHITITDNGWGMRYEHKQEKQHRSMALGITQERIALMNKKQRRKATLHISEAFAHHPERKGVKVTLSLPLPVA